MAVLTGGVITVTPIKFESQVSLAELRRRASARRYPRSSDRPSSGWGGPSDSVSVLNQRSAIPHRGGLGRILTEDATDPLPESLHLRFYFDAPDSRLRKTFGSDARWGQTHSRQAADVIIYGDADERVTRSMLISSRDRRVVTAEVLPAVRDLLDREDVVTADGLPESLGPDFFNWLLWKYQAGGELSRETSVIAIREMFSQDRQLRGARFTDEASIERIEVAALIVLGQARFGPAKMVVGDGPDDVFDVELHRDGGFQVFRGGTTITLGDDEEEPSEEEFGPLAVSCVWNDLLPRMRSMYNRDRGWTSAGRDQLVDMARAALEAILE